MDAARAAFGSKVERLGHFLTQGDPLADAVAVALHATPAPERERLITAALRRERDPARPAALEAFVAELSVLPLWADVERCGRGGAVVLRKGLLSGLVLTFGSLVAGYLSPAGNKPLAFSGRLKHAAARRLAETGRFVQHLTQPGAMAPGAPGWVATARVRLMHARMRQLLLATPTFRVTDWGVPINQADLAATALLFSWVLIDGLRAFGVRVDRDDAEDLLHLWRVVGWTIGVPSELHCTTEPEARTLWALIQATQGAPDADSAALTRALIESPLSQANTPWERARAKQLLPLGYGLSRFLLGDAAADGLGTPKTAWRFTGAALRPLLAAGGSLFERLPLHQALSLSLGRRYWDRAVEARLSGEDARFSVPDAVEHR